ncbi:hypothetical protein ACHAWF_017114 [Thalassiosira exigua]
MAMMAAASVRVPSALFGSTSGSGALVRVHIGLGLAACTWASPAAAKSSSSSPRGVHLGLTGRPGEVVVCFSTAGEGDALVEVAKKSELTDDASWSWMLSTGAEALKQGWGMGLGLAVGLGSGGRSGFLGSGGGGGVEWTRRRGLSTSYVASDLCGEPASSEDCFVSPGRLHSMTLKNLEPGVEHAYHPGLEFGQGDKADDDAKVQAQGGAGVAKLISTPLDQQGIDSIHHIGGLSLARGDAKVWDAYLTQIEPYASRVPLLAATGSAEYDRVKSGGLLSFPSRRRGRRYSYDQTLVHFVILSSEHDLALGSEQNDVTPWVVVELHRPLYGTAPRDSAWLDATVSEGLSSLRTTLTSSSRDIATRNSNPATGCTPTCAGTAGRPPLDGGTDGSSSKSEGYVEVADSKRWGVGRASVHNATAMLWEFVAVGGNVTDEVWIIRDRSQM